MVRKCTIFAIVAAALVVIGTLGAFEVGTITAGAALYQGGLAAAEAAALMFILYLADRKKGKA